MLHRLIKQGGKQVFSLCGWNALSSAQSMLQVLRGISDTTLTVRFNYCLTYITIHIGYV
jgi:hypothetical protein